MLTTQISLNGFPAISR